MDNITLFIPSSMISNNFSQIELRLFLLQVSTLSGAGRMVYRMTGVRGFFQGLTPRMLYQAPSTAVSWSVYEFFKYYLRRQSDKNDALKQYDTIADLRLPSVKAKEVVADLD